VRRGDAVGVCYSSGQRTCSRRSLGSEGGGGLFPLDPADPPARHVRIIKTPRFGRSSRFGVMRYPYVKVREGAAFSTKRGALIDAPVR